VYNKPNGCSETGALAPGPDHHQQQQQQKLDTPTSTFLLDLVIVMRIKEVFKV
jgi:hypothetical protein